MRTRASAPQFCSIFDLVFFCLLCAYRFCLPHRFRICAYAHQSAYFRISRIRMPIPNCDGISTIVVGLSPPITSIIAFLRELALKRASALRRHFRAEEALWGEGGARESWEPVAVCRLLLLILLSLKSAASVGSVTYLLTSASASASTSAFGSYHHRSKQPTSHWTGGEVWPQLFTAGAAQIKSCK